jgi:hypothetical protein
MTQTSPPARGRHGLTWLFLFIALIEAAAIIAFVADRALATAACGAVGAVAPGTLPAIGAAGGVPIDAPQGTLPPTVDNASAPADAGSAGPTNAAPVTAAPTTAAPAQSNAAPASVAPLQGDTNQIVDPKCVARATVALLQASPPAVTPSCGPMNQPEALKAAEKQVAP